MAPKKVSHEEWAKMVTKGVSRHDLEQALGWEYRFRYLRRHLTVPIIIGVAAILLYISLYGLPSFFKDFLSWVIGITIVSTVIAILGPARRR